MNYICPNLSNPKSSASLFGVNGEVFCDKLDCAYIGDTGNSSTINQEFNNPSDNVKLFDSAELDCFGGYCSKKGKLSSEELVVVSKIVKGLESIAHSQPA